MKRIMEALHRVKTESGRAGGLPFHALALCKIYSPGQATSGSPAPPTIEGWCFQLRPTAPGPSLERSILQRLPSLQTPRHLGGMAMQKHLQGPQIKVLAQRRKAPAFRI